MASPARRPSPQTMKLLQALVADPSAWRYGYELGLEVGLRSGSLYPILVRLSDRGLLESRWETDAPMARPPRHPPVSPRRPRAPKRRRRWARHCHTGAARPAPQARAWGCVIAALFVFAA